MGEPIKHEHIHIEDSAENYEDAIRLAAAPLIKDGYIQDAYTDDILESLEKNGPYIVVADYVALPHAQPSEKVLKNGLSLLLLKEPVDLKDNPIHVFIVLAAKDSTAHLSSLQSLAVFLMEKENIDALIGAKTVPGIQKVLEERWQTS